jgi:hypothetical protein
MPVQDGSPPEAASPKDRAAMGKYFGPGGSANAIAMLQKMKSVIDEIKDNGVVQKMSVMGYC